MFMLQNRQDNIAIYTRYYINRFALEMEHMKLIIQSLTREIEQLKEKQ